MITLITGKPGSGKSLLAVEMILENSKADSIRPCFSNIDGLDYKALNCFELEDPENWHKLPEGSLIIIDEVQDWMPPRPSGKAVPEHVDLLNKHRHMGYDIILMTPDPMLIDVTARKTVGTHMHCYRPFGLQHRKVFEWNGCNDTPEPSKNESNALVKKKPFDKSLFGYYKSAQVHTHKARMPWKKLVVLVLAVICAILLFVYAGSSIYNSGHKDVVEKVDSTLEQAINASNVQPSEAVPSSMPNISPFSISPQPTAEPVVPFAFYRGSFSVDGDTTFLIELPSGKYVYLTDFHSYKVNGFITYLYSHETDKPTYIIEDPDFIMDLKS